MNINRVIYQVWAGDNEITPNRKECLVSSLSNIQIPVLLITPEYLKKADIPEPIHPCYKYLSMNHKSDYLRCYFMHFFGGGYADVKYYTKNNNWHECFDYMDEHPEVDICGSKEIPGGGAFPEYNRNPDTIGKLISCGYFICRPRTELTTKWFRRVTDFLDRNEYALARSSLDNPFGGRNYPLQWTSVMGSIFHPLVLEQYDIRSSSISNILKEGRDFSAEYR